jgi:UDP-2,3-diacylglucosamine hydrolase
LIYFVADLHLSPQTPGAIGIFTAFLRRIAQMGNALYILGDFFAAWVGDDEAELPVFRGIVAALRQASDAGLAVAFLHGNRDFLLGEVFTKASGARLLPDPYVLTTPEWQFVLSHGDALCTDDVAYQQFRAHTRSAEWRQAFLAQPLETRRALAERLRQQSEAEKRGKAIYLKDLNPADTDDFLRRHGYVTFIHGHTHQPGRHDHVVDGIHVERWVLADWSETRGETLAWDGAVLARQVLAA